ncbi:MAG: heat-inducible transcription repressor HrcA [Candidatus Omnitrophica bacterium 4484_49]|nr:MAG: heat-inducible transcription repressor HrcA [Candidatus Omnitrophica bacterium 4484_49]
MLEPREVEERRRKILAGIVRTYIETGMPVASKLLVSKYRLGLSSATVRNIMADLEKLGYITHPHTSAGRVPTDKGYRYYVDMLMEEEQLTPVEKRKILMQLLNSQYEEIENLMEEALDIVCNYTRQLSFLFYNRENSIYVEKINLIPITRNKILVVIITESGDVLHFFLEGEELPLHEKLEKFTNFLNSEFKGLSITNIKGKIKTKLISSPDPLYSMFSSYLKLFYKILDSIQGKQLLYQGTKNLVDSGLSGDILNLSSILTALEEKTGLIKLLEGDLKKGDINIYIGEENLCNFISECSIITARYKLHGKPLGTIGILGPKRIYYSRVVSVVKYVADVLTQAIEGMIF